MKITNMEASPGKDDMVATHKAKLNQQKEEERKEKDLANKEREFGINVLEIKKLLGITIKKQGDDTRDDIEKFHNYVVERDLKILREKESYPKRAREYVENRLKDEDYSSEFGQFFVTKNVGVSGDMQNASIIAKEISWRETAQPKGPKWETRYQRYLDSLPKGPTEEQLAQWAKERSDKNIWIRLQKMGKTRDGTSLLMEQHEVIKKAEEDAKAAEAQAEKDRENAELIAQEQAKADRERGFFENCRKKPTYREFMKAVKNWDRGVKEDWDIDTGFPKRNENLIGDQRAGWSVIRDSEGFDSKLHKDKILSDLYIPRDMKSGEIYLAYRQHTIDESIAAAEKWLKDREQELKNAEKRKKLEAKLEARRIEREKQAEIDEINRIKEEEERAVKEEEDRIERENLEAEELRLKSLRETEKHLTKKDKRNRVKPVGKRLVFLEVEKRKQREMEEKEASRQQREMDRIAAEIAAEEERIRNHKTPLQKVHMILRSCSTFITNLTKKQVLHEPVNILSEDDELDELERQLQDEADDRDLLKKASKEASRRRRRKKELEETHTERALAITKEDAPKGCFAHMVRFFRGMKKVKIDPRAVLGETQMDKSRREKAAKDLQRLQSEASDNKIVEAVLQTREKFKAAGAVYKMIADWFRGHSIEETQEFYTGDLLNYANAGNYNMCIDILEHPFSPVGPNEVDTGENITATYAAICASMNLEKAPTKTINVDVDALFESPWSKFMKHFRKAVLAGKIDFVVKILLYKGGDIDFVKTAKDEDGKAVLHLAAMRGLNDSVEWILDRGADINIRTFIKKRTPLMLAAENDHISTVLLLIKRGASLSVNYQDEDGRTALHFAALKASLEMAQVLLICGSNSNIRTKRDRRAADEATAAGRTDMYEQISFFLGNQHDHIAKLAFLNGMYDQDESKSTQD